MTLFDKFRLWRRQIQNAGVLSREYRSSGFIPYWTHYNDHTIMLDNYALMQVVKCRGFLHETADDENLDMQNTLRNFLYKGMHVENLGIYFHTIRRACQVYPPHYNSLDFVEGFSHYMDKRWYEKWQQDALFVNEHYISIIVDIQNTSSESSDSIINKLTGKKDTGLPRVAIATAYDILKEAVGRVTNSLTAYDPEVLGIEKTAEGNRCLISEFIGSIVNCGEHNKMIIPPGPVKNYVQRNRLYFGNRAIEMRQHDGLSKFAGMVSIKEYGPKTWPGMVDAFLQEPFELVITQSFKFINKQKALNDMQIQQNRLQSSGDKGVSQIAEIEKALDMLMSGQISFGKHHFSVMGMSYDLEDLDELLSKITVELTNTGGVGVRESVWNMEPSFWGQLPGNYDFLVRNAPIHTSNLAAFSSIHNFREGQSKDNHWGSAVTVLETTASTPFYFNFHVNDVGHTAILGPTGAGKTVMMNFLCAQALRAKCRLFFFDKDRGAEIFIRALGGQYTIIDPGKSCGFNPFQLKDTGENRTFLQELLRVMASTNDETIDSEDVDTFNRVVNGNYELAEKDRRLRNIAAFLGFQGPGTLASRMGMWFENGSHANIFDNEKDAINLESHNIYGFEMGELLKDKAALSPVLLYLFHRINISLDGTPSVIVLDEAWAMIDNPIFAAKIKDWLKVLRKLNTFVIFATQSVEDASKSDISDTLIQQTATQIFLPNMKATDTYKSAFMLTEREFDIVKNTDPSSRFFLVKQGTESNLARIDLRGMDDVINVLSGRADTVRILEKVLEESDDPNVWIPLFNQRVKEVREQEG